MSLFSRGPSHAVLLGAILALAGPGAARAADTTIATGTTATSQQVVNGADTLTVEAGGALSTGANPAVLSNDAATGVVVTNAGLIESTRSGGRAIRFAKGGSGADATTRSFTIDNRAGATIQSQGDAIQIQDDVKTGTIVVNNAGTIQSTGINDNNGQAIDFDSVETGTASVTINNLATGVIVTADADAIRPGMNATVNNHGQIVSHDAPGNSGADGIDFQDKDGTVHNFAGGLISGGRHGITTKGDVSVTNDAGGTIIGRNGSGVGSDGTGTVVNDGTITGAYDGSGTGDGDGVDIDFVGHITNRGLIQGTGAAGNGSDSLPNTSQGVALGGGTVDNLAGATISGAADGILVDNSSEGPAFAQTTIVNAGTIVGGTGYGIRLISNFDDVITNAGAITGGNGTAIRFGDGNDTLNVRTGSVINGIVDGAGGTDTVSLSGTGTFAGAVNFEVMTVDGGSWTLTGTQGYASGTTVAGGAALAVDGTLTGPIAVAAGGRLSGTGTVGSLDLSGTLAPGASIGTITVNGNATFRAGSVYEVEANAAGAADRASVTGSATIDGGSVSVLAADGAWAPATSYTILSAAGGVAGTFAGVTSNLAFLEPTLGYAGNDVTLTLTRNATFFRDVARGGNASAVAGALDRGPTDSPAYMAVVGQSAGEANRSFAALSGEGVTGAQNVALGTGGRLTGAIGDRLALGAAGGGGTDGASFADASLSGASLSGAAGFTHAAFAGGAIPGAWSRMDGTIGLGMQPLPAGRGLGAWVAGFGEGGRIDGDGGDGSADQTMSVWGALAGIDARLAPNLAVGVAVGSSDGRTSTDARSTDTQARGKHAAAYGVLDMGPWYGAATLAFSRYDNSETRQITGVPVPETATGSFDSRELRGRLEGGRRFAMGGFGVTPFAAVEAARLWTDGFTETSRTSNGTPGTLGLSYDAQTTDSLPAFLGVRVDHALALGEGRTLTAFASVTGSHEFSRDRTSRASFLAAPGTSFEVDGARPAANAVRGRAGAQLTLNGWSALFASATGEVADGSESWGGMGGFRITW